MMISYLLGPGPTAWFKLDGIKLRKDMPFHAAPLDQPPELILNNFNTRLGRRVARMFQSMMIPRPSFRVRQVITCHNQRDFLFFRAHRYIFEQKNDDADQEAIEAARAKGVRNPEWGTRIRQGEGDLRCRLQEIGPQFTLKLRWLSRGLFSSTAAREWSYQKELQTSKYQFFI
ncbi:hypothetical protein KIPB_002493 [Kipferlia bialata]|uniref:Brix domain-containing protein n=1 Tax=Kipferlia bialata TaxID=797122 RepID=A0A9K3GG20_9EUKA|nr:hypothetical protein KIPB_002493 [Kipferlia bialata]|eukprot:g2493.t1